MDHHRIKQVNVVGNVIIPAHRDLDHQYLLSGQIDLDRLGGLAAAQDPGGVQQAPVVAIELQFDRTLAFRLVIDCRQAVELACLAIQLERQPAWRM